ncbi:hypothetical protein EXIGLDRAFT_847737 [Exidia glandulosa HHB12029]|uniref:Uncharacterized protein n=1 Tax=Exidia glandulosa HHB12029 TaxID=1314781 RepID=A0A165Z005_EXIGL|nr:hypothetical protein EXIGLDRAFT_847737 [Exidia glandulosa HHB12029]
MIIEEVWRNYPVVVFSDLIRGDPPASREVKAMIESFKLYPDPAIFEVDQRTDEPVLRPLLQRLTGVEHTPLVIVGGSPIRTMQELRSMNDTGRLKEVIEAAGAKINGRKVKKGRKH